MRRRKILLSAVVCLGVLLPMGARAGQSVPSRELDPGPDLLVPREACPNTAAGPERACPEAVPLDPALFTRYAEVREAGASKQPLLVDVRPLHQFEKFCIPGAIHIPLFALQSKTFLRGKDIILVDEGFSQLGLARECRVLRDAGFQSVHVLRGGLNQWRFSGGEIQGDLAAADQLGRVAPGRVRALLKAEGWIPVAMGGEEQAYRDAFGEVAVLPTPGDPETFRSNLERLFLQHQTGPHATFALFDADGSSYAAAARLVAQVFRRVQPDAAVVFVEGGLNRYLQIERARRRPSGGSTRQTTRGCGTCPQ